MASTLMKPSRTVLQCKLAFSAVNLIQVCYHGTGTDNLQYLLKHFLLCDRVIIPIVATSDCSLFCIAVFLARINAC